MVKFSKKEMSATAKTLRKNIKNGKGYKSYVNMVDMNKKTHKLSKAQYMGLYEAQNVFIMKNGRYPNYVNLMLSYMLIKRMCSSMTTWEPLCLT